MTKEEVKQIRLKNNLTQTQFGEKLGVTLRTVQKWESGQHPVSETVVKLIGLILNK